MLANALNNLKPSPTLLINEESKKLIAQGIDIIKFGFGQSPFPVPDIVIDALIQNAHQKDYLPGKGLPELRNAVARYNERTLSIKGEGALVSIGPGSKELIFGLQLAFNADLILPSPSWVSYEPQARILNKHAWWVDTLEENNWLIDPEQLDSVCIKVNNPNKLLILNYPNNPTGVSYTKEQLIKLVPILQKHNILVIADEIYAELTFNGEHTSLATYYPEATIISGGLSKWCGAGGWRLGTFTFPKEYKWLQDIMATIASETFSAVSAPVQYAAVTAFEGGEEIETYLYKAKKILYTVATYVHDHLLNMNLSVPPATGGFYLFPNFKNYKEKLHKANITTSVELCRALLKDTGIALLPGAAFGRPETELTVRLSFVDFDGKVCLQNFEDTEFITTEFFNLYFPRIITAMQRLQSWLNR